MPPRVRAHNIQLAHTRVTPAGAPNRLDAGEAGPHGNPVNMIVRVSHRHLLFCGARNTAVGHQKRLKGTVGPYQTHLPLVHA